MAVANSQPVAILHVPKPTRHVGHSYNPKLLDPVHHGQSHHTVRSQNVHSLFHIIFLIPYFSYLLLILTSFLNVFSFSMPLIFRSNPMSSHKHFHSFYHQLTQYSMPYPKNTENVLPSLKITSKNKLNENVQCPLAVCYFLT